MTEKTLAQRLRTMAESLREEEYPEICAVLTKSDEETDAYAVAGWLHNADGAKLLPRCVAEFLLETYSAELESGNTDAACDLGSLYYTGRAGEQSYAKAIHYYKIAADGGCAQAQENLGYCYYYGRDTAVDYAQAFHYFALGAFRGEVCSLYKIGDMYRYGYFVARDELEAFALYRRCEERMAETKQLRAEVMLRLADCFFEGVGTERNDRAALYYYQQAERLFYDRVAEGEFLLKSSYEKCIERQNECRRRLEDAMPSFDWTRN